MININININELREAIQTFGSQAIDEGDLNELLDRLEAAEKSDAESIAMYRKARDERDTYKAAYNEWIAKTEWVQDELTCGKLPAKYLGMHRADGIKAEIDALRAKVSEMEQQEPVAWRTFDGEGGYDYRSYEDNENYKLGWDARNPNHIGWVEPLYALPGAQAQPAPIVPDGWIQRGMAELEAIRNRHDDGTLLNDRALIERIGKAMLAAAPEASRAP